MAFHAGGRTPLSILAASCRQPQVPACAPDKVFVVLSQAATLAAADVVNGSPVSIGSDGSRDHSFHEPK